MAHRSKKYFFKCGVGTPGSDVIAEYTSLGVSWILLIDSASVGVMPNALSSLARVFVVLILLYHYHLHLLSCRLLVLHFPPLLLRLFLHHPHFHLHHLGHLDLFVVVVVLAL
jgi:hypothetical protein